MINLRDELSRQKADPCRRQRMIEILNNTTQISDELAVRVNKDWEDAQTESNKYDRVWRAAVRVHLTTQGTGTYERMLRGGGNWDFNHVSAKQDPESYLLKLVNNKLRGPKVVSAWRQLADQKGDVLTNYDKHLRTLKTSDAKIAFFTEKKAKSEGLPILKGIGPKFARNIWLDWADPNVSADRFALDSRIQKIIPLIWRDLDNAEGRALLGAAVTIDELYIKIEMAMVQLAQDAQVSCWRADRIIFRMLDSSISNKAVYDACVEHLQ